MERLSILEYRVEFIDVIDPVQHRGQMFNILKLFLDHQNKHHEFGRVFKLIALGQFILVCSVPLEQSTRSDILSRLQVQF